ncbi:hypothetical protein TZ02_04470 [Clostridium aceticum]|nr:hypothetical protein TZ02_04470 [Clostridium aceticum]
MAMPYHPKLWKPSIVVPVETPEDFKRITHFIRSFIYPSGRVYYLTIDKNGDKIEDTKQAIKTVLEPLKEENLFAHEVFIEGGTFDSDISVVLQSLSSTFLPPNSIFFTISDDPDKQKKLNNTFDTIRHLKIGLMCLHIHSKYGYGQSKKINLWLRDKSPNNNLAVLSALQISKNWSAKVTLCRIVSSTANIRQVEEELKEFIKDARLPTNTRIMVKCGNFEDVITNESTDLNILGMPTYNDEINFEYIVKIMNLVPSSILFVADSGLENALV